jgi:hypothetical protein
VAWLSTSDVIESSRGRRCPPVTFAVAQSYEVKEIGGASTQGYSIAGFNFTSSPVLSWLVNSLVSNRRASIRSYYSVQTLCAPCATKRDAQERRKLLLVSVCAILFALLFVILVVVRH